MKILPDTSVMVASLRENHIHHERAFRWRERVFNGEISGVMATHSLAEIYSTLTRIPPPMRLDPPVAWSAIALTLPYFEIATLTETEVAAVLANLSARNIGGGQVYDALIAAVARKAEVDILLTFNATHFLRVALDLEEKIQEP